MGMGAASVPHVSKMVKRGRSGATGVKAKTTYGLQVASLINCADNTGARNLFIMACRNSGSCLNRLPKVDVGGSMLCTVKKGKPELRKKVWFGVIVRQRQMWRRPEGVHVYFEDNAGVVMNAKGEMKGSAVTGPVAKECAEIYPKISACAPSIA